MKADIKKRWVAALRSGKYKQGRLALNSKGKFCCLGVLCELAVKAGVVSRDTPINKDVYYGDYHYNVLPPPVWKWAGLEGSDPQVKTDNGKFQISQINDELKRRFSTIARLIEEQL